MLITFCVPGAAIGSSTLYPLCVASVKVKSRSQASCQCFFLSIHVQAYLYMNVLALFSLQLLKLQTCANPVPHKLCR